ncbi:MAG: YqgE/AlgH family protein [Myxococcota bacterium]|nr:YqgE/AlgH family protein [Myxococcota bacterium]
MVETRIVPGFLVAAPQLRDPNFEGAVVLMIEHANDEGSLGLIINREASVDLSMVIGEMKLDAPLPVNLAEHPPVLCGGPVALERGWVLHSPDWSGPHTRQVEESLSVTSSVDVLQAILVGRGPQKYRFYLGYSGWGPNQLVEEIKSGAWINVPFNVNLIFDVPLRDIWRDALARLGIHPSQLVPTVGDA